MLEIKEGQAMKKLVAALATGAMIAGTGFMNVSAETYEVENGDSLWDIAKEFNTTIEDLVDINNLESTTIQPKQELVVNDFYVVEKGDTLSAIGKEFNVSVSKIKKWNDLDSDLITVGQELEIKGAKVSNEQSNEVEEKNASDNDEQTQNNSSESESSDQGNTSEETASESTESSESNQAPEGKTVSVSATAYTAKCDGCSGVTSTGVDLNANPNAKVIAVDPSVIPLGSEVYVEGYGYATAADVGGAIKGNKIDVHVPTKDEAVSWGVRTVEVTIIN